MNNNQVPYAGRAYIGVVSGDLEYGECRDSIARLIIRQEDSEPVFSRGTKGFESRQIHFNRFIAGHYDWLFLMDGDMVFAPDSLERLRSHGRPFISGFYMRRRFHPIAPVWFEPPAGNGRIWPYKPWLKKPKGGRLYELGASGWGCILIHREVVLAVRQLLKGHADVIEDDMDLWPYDLSRVMFALNGLQEIIDEQPRPRLAQAAMREHVRVLREEIRPLRGTTDNVGSDIRYAFFARAAGYPLYGDPDVCPGHMINYPLSVNDWTQVKEKIIAELDRKVEVDTTAERDRVAAGVEALAQ